MLVSDKLKNKTFRLTVFFLLIVQFGWCQFSIEDLSQKISKGKFAILELRLNTEDEFRTLEGRDSKGLARITLFVGADQNPNILFKGFNGFNQVVDYLNDMEKNGWKLQQTYSITGSALIINHYVFQKIK